MRIEAAGLGDVGDGVLHRVAGEQHVLLGHPHHGGVVAVDVDVDQLEAKAAHVEAHAVVEGQGGEDQRIDPGRAAQRSRLDRAPASRRAARPCARVAITSQSAKAAVPATWSRWQWLSRTTNRRTPSASRACADEAGVLDRHVRVVDQRLVAVDDRVAGDAERQRAVIDPVGAVGEAVALDAPVVEGADAVGRMQRCADGARRERYATPIRAGVSIRAGPVRRMDVTDSHRRPACPTQAVAYPADAGATTYLLTVRGKVAAPSGGRRP